MSNFYDNTLTSKYIKYLLMNTPLPNCSFPQNNSLIVKDNLYYFRNSILKCTKSGVIVDQSTLEESVITCNDFLICGSKVSASSQSSGSAMVDLTCGMQLPLGGLALAEYEKIHAYDFGQSIRGLTDTFISTSVSYDHTTHMRLGKYLRSLRAGTGLDLMSLYNCFSNYWVDNVDLVSGEIKETMSSGYKTTLIPINYNTKYTLYMNSNVPIYTALVLYDRALLRDEFGQVTRPLSDASFYVIKHNYVSPIQPILLEFSNTDPYKQGLEDYLYIALQAPDKNDSRIVVLEGDYRDVHATNYSMPSMINFNPLSIDAKYSPPYSNKLIEYLCRNTIDVRETIEENVEEVSNAVGYEQILYKFDDKLRDILRDRYMNLSRTRSNLNYTDILGYVDSDIERALVNKYI